jgi:hypothetical protein
VSLPFSSWTLVLAFQGSHAGVLIHLQRRTGATNPTVSTTAQLLHPPLL